MLQSVGSTEMRRKSGLTGSTAADRASVTVVTLGRVAQGASREADTVRSLGTTRALLRDDVGPPSQLDGRANNAMRR